MSVVERPGQFQVLDLNKKILKKIHYFVIKKILTLKPYT
jgi:hypothetical protein